MQLHGFRVVSVTPVPAFRGTALQFEHSASGARVLHLYCDDSENAFTINLSTPPPDDTGMPHILEHMVLAGSRKFPVKEPFFEMVKMSMATFINAMTGYDTTYYPVCSNVEKDLFNLADVYFDAVFHPLLSRETFDREGHHLAPGDPAVNGGLRIDGIVYSEMQGVFSDPASILARDAVRHLLPDTCYGMESGGDPVAIPDLTHEALCDFHARHYHPSNALFVFYGNFDTERYLTFLAPRLEGYNRIAPTPPVTRQPRWSQPRQLRSSYPIGNDESTSEKSYLLLTWLVGDLCDPVDATALRLLATLLLGHSAAPLHRALIDARLGADITMTGAGEAGCELTFAVGLEGSEGDRFDAFQQLVDETLTHLAATPFSSEEIETAFQQLAYQALEIGPLHGLNATFRITTAWLAGLEPLTFLDDATHFRAVRTRLESEPTLFNRLIRERLLDNQHRLAIILEPDKEYAARTEAEVAARLTRLRSSLDDAGMAAIAATAAALDASNGTPNPPEAVALLPQLKISDLPAEPLAIPTSVEKLAAGSTLLLNDLPTNDIAYLNLTFDLSGLPPHLWPYLPRYTEAIGKFGAGDDDFATLARRASANTGGIAAAVSFHTSVAEAESYTPTLSLGVKTLTQRVDQALDVVEALLFDLNVRDTERMRDVLSQARSANRISVIQAGNETIRLQAGRHLSAVKQLDYLLNGLPQLTLSEDWVENFASANSEVSRAIEEIKAFITSRGRFTASITAAPRAVDAMRQRLSRWEAQSGAPGAAAAPRDFTPSLTPQLEGLAAPLQIAHCAMLMPAPHYSHPDEPLLAIGAHLLTMDYMLPEIRFKGNAYGAGFRYAPLNGHFHLYSFRDPKIATTIETFRRTLDYVQQAPWRQSDIDSGIIGVAKRDDAPLRPGPATGLAMQRHLTGETFELRLARRKKLLQATPESVKRALTEALQANLPAASICAISSRAKLEEAAIAGMTISEVLK